LKFSDGYWRPAPGMTSIFPEHVHEVVEHDRSFTVYAPTRPVINRRNTLNNPLVAITVWSPADNVVGVRVEHHSGARTRTPQFVLDSGTSESARIERTDAEIVLHSGEVSLHISLDGDWAMAFRRRGELLTEGGIRSIGIARDADGSDHAFQRLALPEGDLVYGLGERSTALVKNGQSIDTWNDDGGPSSWHSYKSIPFFMTNRGWGAFVNSSDRVGFEVGSEYTSQVQFSTGGKRLEYFLLADDSPKGVLDRYTRLTGRPAIPPRWSFGLWLSTSFVTEYDEATVTSFVDEMAARDIPLSVLHFDTFWMREFHWCDFEWDPAAFPDPAGMLERLRARGLRTSVWINPYIAERSSLFREAADAGYLLRKPNGDVWQWDTWQAGMAIVDFTNPAAREWFSGKLRALLDMGVDCFKTDFGERIPLDVVYHDGSDPRLMHNYYSYLYNETVFSTLQSHRGAGDAVVFARSATTGGQKFPVHWGGDPEPTFVSMAETLRSGLSLGMSGFGFWSHDIGGFEGEPSPDVFMRWAAFGLLSSHSRLHGSVSYRVPWRFGDRAVEVVRDFTKLKMRLMPYLFAAARDAHLHGTPMMRAMALEFPEDPACAYLDRQYMLGSDVLVAPVFRADGRVSYYVPAGTWTHLLTGRVLVGPGWRDEVHDVDSLPLLARPGSVVAWGAVSDGPDYDYRDDVTLEVYFAGDAGVRDVVVAGPVGQPDSTFRVTVEKGTLSVVSDSPLPWRVLLVGQHSAEATENSIGQVTDRGVQLAPSAGGNSISAVLAAAP
jgi:alpha-D-xyloside xylohydrolase